MNLKTRSKSDGAHRGLTGNTLKRVPSNLAKRSFVFDNYCVLTRYYLVHPHTLLLHVTNQECPRRFPNHAYPTRVTTRNIWHTYLSHAPAFRCYIRTLSLRWHKDVWCPITCFLFVPLQVKEIKTAINVASLPTSAQMIIVVSPFAWTTQSDEREHRRSRARAC